MPKPSVRFCFLCALSAYTLGVVAPLASDIPYRVEITGTLSEEARQALIAHSQLIALQERPPTTITSLQRRASADLSNLVQALHGLALFNAEIELYVDTTSQPAIVRVSVDAGEVFRLESFRVMPASTYDARSIAPDRILSRGKAFLEQDFLNLDQPFDWNHPNASDPVDWVEVVHDENKPSEEFDLSCVTDASLGLTIDGPAYPTDILHGEEALLSWVNCQGYPLAEIVKREVVADQTAHTINVILYLKPGPLAFLASPNITGNKRVCTTYISRKVAWEDGDCYTPKSIDCTFDALERSGLFRNINIELGSQLDDDGLLPVDINVAEGRHRSVGFGVEYSTQWGGGLIGEWENRNMRGMGEQLSFKGELLNRFQTGELSYRTPDFLCKGLDWVNSIEGEHEVTDSFHEHSWTGSSRLYRRLSPCFQGWIGVALMYTMSKDTDNNKPFTLLKFPMQIRYGSSDNPLDPSHGMMANLKFTPTTRLFFPNLKYYMTRFDCAAYLPVGADNVWTLAGKLTYGFILGAARKNIPPPERFYAGSPNTLRGYRYLTVSPLDSTGKPEGGRSLMVVSLEARRRLTETWGVVGFWEVGNVYETCAPRLLTHQLQSTGIGLRYYTQVGPLRLDIAFPLNRRKALDAPYQIYFSIGQTY